MSELLRHLAAIVGQANVLIDDLSTYEQDWRRRSRGKARCVVRPANTLEVAAVVRACASLQSQGQACSIVAQGGNTGLVDGSTPDASGTQVVLSLQRMRAVRGIDAANQTMTVEAGCVLQTAQEAAFAAGFLFPLSLAAEGSCTIGGNLATNAGGTQVLRYGNARDLCLGLEAVTAQGDVMHKLAGLRKDNTGYDLRNLLIGSEGTLGIITAATLKLFPMPVARSTAWAAAASLESAVELLGLAQRHLGPCLTGFEAMGQFALQLTDQHFPQLKTPFVDSAPWCVLLENSDHESEAHARQAFERLLEAAMEAGLIHDAVVAENQTQAKHLWHIRERIPLAQAQEGLNIKHDISVPISRIARFVQETDAVLHATIPGCRLVNFGHLGDGNLHYNVQCPAGADGPAFLVAHEKAANAIVYERVRAHGGSISAEHGIGSMKRDALAAAQDPASLAMMRAIKHALDPLGLLNPGRVL